MNTPESNERITELMLGYLDEALDEGEIEEFDRRLRVDPAARRQAAEMVLYDLHLRQIFQEEKSASTGRLPARVLLLNSCAETFEQMARALGRPWRWALGLGSAAVLLGLA